MELPDNFVNFESNEDANNPSQVNLFVLINQRLNTLEALCQQLNMRLLTLEGSTGNTMAMGNSEYPDEWSLRSVKDYTSYAEKRIANIKLDNEWRKNFLSIEFPGLNEEAKERIISAIFKQRLCVSSIVNTIAKETIGSQKLSYQSLGCHGLAVATGGSTKNSRPTVDQEDENKFRAVVGFLDKIFVSKNGWEYLVRRPVNQMGREFKAGKRDQADISALTHRSPKQPKLSGSSSCLSLTNAAPSLQSTLSNPAHCHTKAITAVSANNKDHDSGNSSCASKEMSNTIAKDGALSSIGNRMDMNASNNASVSDFFVIFLIAKKLQDHTSPELSNNTSISYSNLFSPSSHT